MKSDVGHDSGHSKCGFCSPAGWVLLGGGHRARELSCQKQRGARLGPMAPPWCLSIVQGLLFVVPAALSSAPGGGLPQGPAPAAIHLSAPVFERLPFYHDPKAQLTAVEAGRAASWKTMPVPLGVGYTDGALWVRIELHNDTSEQEFLVENQVAFVDRIELFVFSGEALLLAKVAGASQLPDGKYPNPLFRLSVPPGASRTLLLRYSGGASILVDPVIHNLHDFGIQRSLVHDLQVAYFAAIFLILLLNMVLYARTRNSTFVVYSVYVGAAGFYQFAYAGFARIFILPGLGSMHNRLLVLSGTLALVGVIVFSLRFLSLRRQSPPLFGLLVMLAALLSLNALSSPFLPAQWADRAVHLLSAPTALILLGAGVWSYRQQFRPARLYALGWLCLVVGIVVFNLFALGILNLPGARHAIQVATFMEMLLFNFAVADRLLAVRPEQVASTAPGLDSASKTPTRLAGLDVAHKLEELRRLLAEDHLYADEDLCVGRLALLLDVRPDQLSEMINRSLGTSFTGLVNAHRIEAAKRLLVEQPQRSVLQIAFAVGFNTKSTFYEAFQRQVKLKPSEYRRHAATGGAAPH